MKKTSGERASLDENGVHSHRVPPPPHLWSIRAHVYIFVTCYKNCAFIFI